MNIPPTPTLDRMKEVQPVSQAIGEFLEWLQREKGVTLAKYHDHADHEWSEGGYDCDESEDMLVPWNYGGIERLLADYFDIDLNAAEREKQAILECL